MIQSNRVHRTFLILMGHSLVFSSWLLNYKKKQNKIFVNRRLYPTENKILTQLHIHISIIDFSYDSFNKKHLFKKCKKIKWKNFF